MPIDGENSTAADNRSLQTDGFPRIHYVRSRTASSVPLRARIETDWIRSGAANHLATCHGTEQRGQLPVAYWTSSSHRSMATDVSSPIEILATSRCCCNTDAAIRIHNPSSCWIVDAESWTQSNWWRTWAGKPRLDWTLFSFTDFEQIFQNVNKKNDEIANMARILAHIDTCWCFLAGSTTSTNDLTRGGIAFLHAPKRSAWGHHAQLASRWGAAAHDALCELDLNAKTQSP